MRDLKEYKLKQNTITKEKETALHKALDKNVNPTKLYLLLSDFTCDGMINAKGRFYIKLVMVFVVIVYLIGDKDLISSLTLLSLLTISVPLVISIITRYIIKKQKVKEDNLYDLLYLFGLYIICIIPLIAGIIFAVKKAVMLWPEAFETYKSVPGIIIILGLLLFMIDGIAFSMRILSSHY